MNVYDGERMAELLAAQGMTAADAKDDADLVVLNTCHIREKAAGKVYSDIGRLRREDGSAPLIAVAGCVAQAEGEEIMGRAPSVRVVQAEGVAASAATAPGQVWSCLRASKRARAGRTADPAQRRSAPSPSLDFIG